jgi:hypothetical protein
MTSFCTEAGELDDADPAVSDLVGLLHRAERRSSWEPARAGVGGCYTSLWRSDLTVAEKQGRSRHADLGLRLGRWAG